MLYHGVDLVEVARIARIRARHEERFLERVFTPAERDYALASRRCDERLAVRFAAKEAVMKALGTGQGEGVRFRDIEVVHDERGVPMLALHGRARIVAHVRRIRSWTLSLSHVREIAIASVIAVADYPPPPVADAGA